MRKGVSCTQRHVHLFTHTDTHTHRPRYTHPTTHTDPMYKHISLDTWISTVTLVFTCMDNWSLVKAPFSDGLAQHVFPHPFLRLLLCGYFTQLTSTQVATVQCSAHILQRLTQMCLTVSTNVGHVFRPKDCKGVVLFFLKDLNLPKPDKWVPAAIIQTTGMYKVGEEELIHDFIMCATMCK